MRKLLAAGGFALVELLVVVAIVTVLAGILMPAIQAARESARRTSCMNRLRQLGTAAIAHEGAQGFFPTGGWGFSWVGDPDRGAGRSQPGGWVYNLLDYIEETSLRERGRHLPEEKKKVQVTQVTQTVLPLFICPTRRTADLRPYASRIPPVNAYWVDRVAKSDYAMNGGDRDLGGGPGPISLRDARRYKWTDFSDATGISHTRSEVRLRQIGDGTGQTYLIGEKYRMSREGTDLGDDQSMFIGYDYDTIRWTKAASRPRRDGPNSAFDSFGGPHAHGCQFAFVDGSVRTISFNIQPEIHQRLGNRQDGGSLDVTEL